MDPTQEHATALEVVARAFAVRTRHLQRLMAATEELLERIDETFPDVSEGDPDYQAVAEAMRACDEILNARYPLTAGRR